MFQWRSGGLQFRVSLAGIRTIRIKETFGLFHSIRSNVHNMT